MYFISLELLALSFGFFLSAVVTGRFVSGCDVPVHNATFKLLPEANDSDIATYNLFQNISKIQIIATFIAPALIEWLAESAASGVWEFILCLICSVIFGLCVVFVLVFFRLDKQESFFLAYPIEGQ